MQSFEKYVRKRFIRMKIDIDFTETQELVFMKLQLKNDSLNRTFIFKFRVYGGLSNNEIAEFVQFSIDNEIGDHILFEHFWRLQKGKEYRIVSLINQVQGDTFEERLNNYFEIVKETLENDLKAVVEGKEWIDLRYDPRDDYI
jgi:hypothetical protein